MKIKIYIVLLLASISFNGAFGQKVKLRKATDSYVDFDYVKTSDILLKVAKDGYKSGELFKKLGDSFYFNNKMEDASRWYGELMELTNDVEPDYFFRYAQALRSVQNYEESDKWMLKYYEAIKASAEKEFVSSVDYLSDIPVLDEGQIKLYNLNLNTEFSDFGSTIFNDQLVFASSRGEGELYSWNGQPYLDLYSATKTNDSTYVDVTSFDSNINTKFHESSTAFTPDYKTLFFTRNNYYRKRYRKGDDNINKLKIYKASWNEKKKSWDNIEPISFDSDNYSVSHPCINRDGTKIYFASDMPGTHGLSDLYVAQIKKDGTLGAPRNLGDEINTPGLETFPYMSPGGDLYFSSNGYPGLGGLDVYVVRDFEKKNEDQESVKVENLGIPMNSPQDDFGYQLCEDESKGYISSNRPNGKGDDDIYAFQILPCKQLANGTVLDKKTLEILPGSLVRLLNEDGTQLIDSVVADEQGRFSFQLDCEQAYLARGKKDGYIGDEKHFSTPAKSGTIELQLLFEKDTYQVKPGDDLAKILDIPIIYFDFDKYNIRYDAEVELQKVLNVLTEHPQMAIDIRSHTDCRGTSEYNEVLSDRRAQSTRQYLVDHGVDPNRLTARGYGESQPINDCQCEGAYEVPCSEKEHQLNRRSEFIIMKLK